MTLSQLSSFSPLYENWTITLTNNCCEWIGLDVVTGDTTASNKLAHITARDTRYLTRPTSSTLQTRTTTSRTEHTSFYLRDLDIDITRVLAKDNTYTHPFSKHFTSISPTSPSTSPSRGLGQLLYSYCASPNDLTARTPNTFQRRHTKRFSARNTAHLLKTKSQTRKPPWTTQCTCP